MFWSRSSKKSAPRRRRSWRPDLEQVEGRQLMTGNLYVLGTDGNLWLEHPGSTQARTLIDTQVQSFAPDPQRAGFVYVEGTDHNLWHEDPGWQSHGRTEVDTNVEKFAIDPTATGFIYVEGTDHNLWREATGSYQWLLLHGRVEVDSNVQDFAVDPYQAGYLYVEGTDHNLWHEAPGWQLPKHGRTWVDSSVQQFAVDPYLAGTLYVKGTDGNLWHEGAGWQQHGRTWVDSSVQDFAVDTLNQGDLYVQGTDGNLWYEAPGWQQYGRTYVDGTVRDFALDPFQVGGTYVPDVFRAEYDATAYETGGNGVSVHQLLGQPTTGILLDVPGVANAIEQIYQGGVIYWSAATGAHAVYGGIGAKYNSLGGPAGYGLPVGDEMDVTGLSGVRVASFLNGDDIYWSAATDAHAVYGLIGAEYAYTAVERDYYGNDVQAVLGAPITDEMDVPGVSGARMNLFQHGAVYWSSATGTHAIYGGMYLEYYSLGGPTGKLGLPITDELGGEYDYFQHGMIIWNPQTDKYSYEYWG